ncbi:Tungstate-binding protein TupA [Moorella humiferrea]|uniref:substrate-binding domain-containing protein n=1 Tax=Neomoorella humiferrea TaxID=676965 RepID=UPI0030CD2B23
MYKSKRRTVALLIFAFLLAVIAGGCSRNAGQGNNQAASTVGGTGGKEPAQKKEIILATTTSTMDTGLLDVLIPMFEEKTGYIVKPNAVGTGQALAMGEQGNADVLLVHAPEAEMELVAKGTVINRRLVMHNDFIIVGPPEDPAGIRGIKKADGAFKQIAAGKALFISRGDDSGTHKMEKKIWQEAGIKPEGKWYQEAGSGMGQTLNIASEKGGYTLTDRGTYLALRKNLKLEVMVEGDRALLNIYHVMQVNPDKFPGITLNSDGAQAFVDFMTDPETQKVIGDFGRDKFGQPLFFPDAGKDEASLGQ